MRNTLLILLLSALQTLAGSAYSQTTKLNLEMRNATIREVLLKIEEESNFYFLYNEELIDVSEKVTISVKGESIEHVLSTLFDKSGVKATINDRHIVLTPSPDFSSQQQRMVSGQITDSSGLPLPGVTIVVKGTTKGTITDADGHYSLSEVSGTATLVFSFVGMKTQEILVENQSTINVEMQEDAIGIGEVVAIGYGTMRKKDLTGSITQIRPDRIANESPQTVQDVLRGTPGLQVGYNASAKGGGTMQIRGQRSIYTDGGHNNPLIILDGMIFYGELSEINPDDISQIDVLKDASAAAVYGAKAASGVILITTKRGKLGKPVISINSNISWRQKSEYRDRFSPEAYLQHRQDWYTKNTYGVNPETDAYEAYQSGIYANQPGFFMRPEQLPAGVSIDAWRAYTTNDEGESDQSIHAKRLGFEGNALENYLAGRTVDWAKLAFRTGFNQDYNASISGASENANYYLSIGYLKNQGALISDEYEAIRANMKVEAKVTDWFEVGANVNFQDRSDGNIDIDQDYFLRNSPYADYADEMGNPVQYPLSSEYSQRGYNYDFQRQYLELEKGYTVFNSILNAKISLPFNITYSFNASPRFQFFYDRYFMSADLPGSDPKSRGANREQAKRFDWSLNNTINWDYTFNEKHHVVVTLVQEAEERQYWQDRIEARNILPSDALGFHNTKNGSKENSTYSSYDSYETADALLARLFYSYDSRYMVTSSVRRDGYSAFGSSNPYATFPSVALGWTFTNEKFYRWSHVLSSGKMRVSYGKNGNRSLANPYLALANLYEGAGKMQGYINKAGELELMRYLMADRMANPNLQWEKTASWNFGLDFGLFNDRITGSLEYYDMSTHDMIMNQRLPEFTGFSSITTNLGQVDNRGIEISINSVNLNNSNLKWTTSFGFSYNKNEIKHLYYENQDLLDENGNVTGTKEMDDITNHWFIGQPISTIWNYRVTGIWQTDEVEEAKKYGQSPGDPKVANNYTADDIINSDGSVKPVYNDNDKEFLGQTAPPFHWSLRNEFVLWKDLSLSFNIYSYMGHKSLSGNYLNNDDDGGRMAYALQNVPAKEYWTPENPTNEYGRIEAKGPTGAENAQMLYDRSFIRLENISVGYTLPQMWTSKLDIERVKVYGSVRNVANWAKDWEYGDPETGGLSTRVYTLGLNLTF
ncbi:SusC/RagA family TonB-linked outer membrane protein [Gaoshiqia sediminis]|uniref:SusC/RagA family TonB-linked outer membrane protein n=1 Tax=Gaoshiqia sediminis TaxID=2986998 RepID=A0AA41YAA3_9BACT|nr:SusC/RagA family TonB-linked outer membrane protein [Gaoshiqia sediminis]MCW0484556.1 SusC/RagA family TonB-linked outer membrane protein [Gaoshiqia sediminis]